MPSSWLDVGLLSAFVCGYIWSQWMCMEWKQSCSVGPLVLRFVFVYWES